ncbi:MAG: 3' terminal RNA ribose 2'-O-methyltransferase Hen1 [Actinobacteria bacterium]|nr:3' terminal RNA ribose 2'-O-methyltransferase Hen1 [Actinomycetota bacterium]MBI3686731.1 3' terminal RNA ribose 2'-O-methyltransferase Hen1 [Actinomycetota bacterium]
MLLTVTMTRAPATDLGYLLHKHPQRVQTFEVGVGTAHVFYPEATEARCTAALLLEVDPVGLVRGRKGPAGDGFALGQYVNDRPYAASSMLAVAMTRVFKTAMTGRCEARPDLAAAPLPLELHVPALPCRGGPDLASRLFEPLGWQVGAASVPLDEQFPDWGDSRYVDLRLTGELRLADALNHLYVLLPVLDDAKHYWVSPDEVDKLIRAGGGWLGSHPERALITRRYLAHRATLVRSAVARLAEVDDTEPERLDNATDAAEVGEEGVGEEPERPVPLVQQRHGAVLAALRASGAQRVADLGCGDGALLARLLDEPAFTRVIGADVASRALERAERRLKLDRMPERKRERLSLITSSLTYRDDRLAGLDAAVLMEVIEHVDPPRLPALERTVFGDAAPRTVLVTTPNVEHNVRFESLPAGTMRHRDHRFEWSRAQFRDWAARVAAAHGYTVRFLPVGTDDPEVGPPTQMAVFTKAAGGNGVDEVSA